MTILNDVLTFTLGQPARIVVTLTEKILDPTDSVQFRFTQRTTKETVDIVFTESQDESGFKYRYNQYTIDVDTYFATLTPGMWTYEVTEVNTDQTLLECGIMTLTDPNAPVATVSNEQTNTFTVYHGG